jgi:transaldolase
MPTLNDLKIKLYADGADIASMLKLYQLPYIQGFTTNPTLMNKAGITDYEAFAKQVLEAIPDRSVSFEVFSDDFDDMARQARRIAEWGEHVYVKIPVTNTKGQSATPLIRELTDAGVKLNVTAVFTLEQTEAIAKALQNGAPAILSIFAGRIADAGIDPVPLMADALKIIQPMPNIELLWASPREVFNVVQANDIGCHIITATPDILGKLKSLGKDLTEFSLDTVKMFFNDATAAGFNL